ncbi:MAG: serine/threonine-protein kinase RsbT [Herpetosiphonaceae bacterium]|nr:MAG: serine/threonine-protein kinase RsbT [Herpetosiphonaceae bacterium]
MGKQIAGDIGFSVADQTRIEIVVLELAWNIVLHAGEGEIIIQPVECHGRQGLEVVAQDHGPGIADPELALQDGYSTTKTMGAGLPAVRRLMDEFDLQTSASEGTKIRTIRWLQRPSRRNR